jgi:hypothetical protein
MMTVIYSYSQSHLFNALVRTSMASQFIYIFTMGSGDFPMPLVAMTFQLISIFTMGSNDFPTY